MADTKTEVTIDQMVNEAAGLARTVVTQYSPPDVADTCFQEVFKDILSTLSYHLDIEKNESKTV